MPFVVVIEVQAAGRGDVVPAFETETVVACGLERINGEVGVEVVVVGTAGIDNGVAVARE